MTATIRLLYHTQFRTHIMDFLNIIIKVLFILLLICFIIYLITYLHYRIYLKFYPSLKKIKRTYTHFNKEIKKIEPYVSNDFTISSFEKIDRQIYYSFEMLDNSLKIVANILNSLSRLEQIKFNALYLLPNKDLEFIWIIRDAKRNVFDGEREVGKWIDLFNQLQVSLKSFIDLKQKTRERLNYIESLVKNIERDFSRLYTNGNKGLENHERDIKYFSDYIAKSNRFFTKIPDANLAKKPALLEYRYMIDKMSSRLGQIEDKLVETKNYLDTIEQAQKWCEKNLELLKEDNQKIQIKLGRLAQDGLNVIDFSSKVDKLCHKINEISDAYLRRTPAAYIELCGSIDNPGEENSILKNILAEQIDFKEHIIEIETTSGNVKKRIKALQNSLQQELQQIRQFEGKQSNFDLSRIKLHEAELLLKQALEYIQFSDLDKLRSIFKIINKGFEFIEHSKNLRNMFNEHITFLVSIENLFETELKPKLIKFFEILKDLAKFNFDFLQIMPRRPEEWENLVQKYSQQLIINRRINMESVIQSDIQKRYFQVMDAKKEIEKLVNEVESLEEICNTYKKLNSNIQLLDQQIRNQWKQVKKLSKNGPLDSWRKEFEVISKLKDEWTYKWPSNNGELLESLNETVEKLYQRTSNLIKSYEGEKKKLEDQILIKFDNLFETWEWLDKKMDSFPKPSLVLYELKDRSLDYRAKFDSVERFPLDLYRFNEQLSTHLRAVIEKKNVIVNEEKEYNIILKQTLKHKKDAWNIYRTTENYISKKIIPGHWPIINENDKQNLNSIHSNLSDCSNFIDHLISPHNFKPINSIINSLSEGQGTLQKIISQIKEYQLNLTDRYSRITAKEETVNFLLELYNEKHPDAQLNSEIINLISKAKNSADFQSSELLLESAVRQLENIIPNSKEPIHNIYTTFYNEEANQGVQIGRDFTQQFGPQYNRSQTPNIREQIGRNWRKSLEDDIQKLLENINVKKW